MFRSYLAPVVYQNTMGLSRNLSLLLGGFTAVTYMFASFIPLWVSHYPVLSKLLSDNFPRRSTVSDDARS